MGRGRDSRRVDDADHAALAVAVGRAVVPDGVGAVDGDGEGVVLQAGGYGLASSVFNGLYIAGTTYSNALAHGDVVAEEAILGQGLARGVERGAADRVSLGPEAELDRVADLGGDGLGLERQAVLARDDDLGLGRDGGDEGQQRREDGAVGDHDGGWWWDSMGMS